MHSFFELTCILDNRKPFILTTVDTIFGEREFADYVSAFQNMLKAGSADGMMGITDYIDDEKPLYVKTDTQLNILAFLDSDEHHRYVSAGIYGLTPRSLSVLNECIARGESRMRNFQRALLGRDYHLKAWSFSKVLDIDHGGTLDTGGCHWGKFFWYAYEHHSLPVRPGVRRYGTVANNGLKRKYPTVLQTGQSSI